MFAVCQVGVDVPACLQEALIRKGLDIRVAALVRKSFFVLITIILHGVHTTRICFYLFFTLMQVGSISHIIYSFYKLDCSRMYFMCLHDT